MKYDIKLKIEYRYAAPVSGGRHLLRVQPVSTESLQRVVATSLDIDPKPAEASYFDDFFGNRSTYIAFSGRQKHLDVVMKARVHVEKRDDDDGRDIDLTTLAQQLHAMNRMDRTSPHHFLGASPRAPTNELIVEYTRKSLKRNEGIVSLVDEMCQRIRDEFNYDADATDVDTPVEEAFAQRHGVCQDFSHVLIIGLRGLGIPAGYVSGFIRTVPPPGQKRLEGADAMHAWVNVWCGEKAGWIGFDPTNAVRANTDHIVIGHGRDYSDVAPIVGVLKSTGEHKTDQLVDVIPVT